MSDVVIHPPIKFCKDCKHYRASCMGCTHPSIPEDLVTGRSLRLADFMRAGKCGYDARLFDPGPPDFEVKAKEISRKASRDALLILVGIFMVVGVIVYLVVLFKP